MPGRIRHRAEAKKYMAEQWPDFKKMENIEMDFVELDKLIRAHPRFRGEIELAYKEMLRNVEDPDQSFARIVNVYLFWVALNPDAALADFVAKWKPTGTY